MAPEVAEEIKKRLFVFEDISVLDDASITKLVDSVPSADLALALKTIDAQLRERVFDCAPRDHTEELRAEHAALGNVRLRDVEAAQQQVVAVIRRLEEEGSITVARADELA